MKLKFGSLVSTAMLGLNPLTGALTTMTAGSNQVQAANNWDYDTANPGLGEYDQLLQNAGPSDGQVDWYPAERFASSQNLQPALLVKQLIALSVATNTENSKARQALFNNTTGSSTDPEDQELYQKYNLAFGFIAQLLAFNNEKTGQGAYLKQGFESPDGKQPGRFREEDKFAETGKTPDGRITEIPLIGEGRNLADVLGRAFFGNAADAYAQLYVNGYDNTVQNAPNLIRETTTSITIVAQSKLTNRKATAIFKLNNKTFNNLPPEVLLENNIDHSPAFSGAWGNGNIPNDEPQNLGDSTNGTFNQRKNLITGITGAQRQQLSNGNATAWVDPQTGSGTIVVPRGTSAVEIAKKIKQLGYKSNYNITNVAPMKAIHGDWFNQNLGNSDLLATADNSYNVTKADSKNMAVFANEPLSNNQYVAVADPRLDRENPSIPQKLTNDFSNSLLATPFNTNDLGAGGLNQSYDNRIASKIPNQGDRNPSEVINPGASHDRIEEFKSKELWPAFITAKQHQSGSSVNPELNQAQGTNATYPFGGNPGAWGGEGGTSAPASVIANQANDRLGNVVHAFAPSSGSQDSQSPFKVREAWDDTHAIFGMAPFSSLTEEEITRQIANNGSFNNSSGDQIKKSFTFNMPLNNSVLKSYRNPYSTVISTALPFAQGNSAFKAGDQYTGSSGDDLNSDLSDLNQAGNYGTPKTNPWYHNLDQRSSVLTTRDQEPFDQSGHPIRIAGGSTIAHSLHLSKSTWENQLGQNNSRGIYNINTEYKHSGRPKNTEFAHWFYSDSLDYDGNDNNQLIYFWEFNSDQIDSRGTLEGDPPRKFATVIDGNNQRANEQNDYVDPQTGRSWDADLSPSDINVNSDEEYVKSHKRTVRHLQLAKDVGYILINASGLNEQTAQKLSQYQIPQFSSYSIGFQNADDFNSELNRPKINPVKDDSAYRGGLIGVMAINNPGRAGQQQGAGSIYNSQLAEGAAIKVPGLGQIEVKNDYHQGPFSKGQFATDTDLHYELAWNDSSDLPQVQIRRSLNVQYLVPVSIARTVETVYGKTIYAKSEWDGTSYKWQYGYPLVYKSLYTQYYDYRLFLGNVKLTDLAKSEIDGDEPAETGNVKAITNSKHRRGYYQNPGDVVRGDANAYKNNFIETTNDSLAELKPVNNQIAYTRVDQSYPHYDSELFDRGSNSHSVTATHDGHHEIGNTTEKDGDQDTNTKYVGSSDDYAIGIVKAPTQFFDSSTKSLRYTGAAFARDTENKANGMQGMNPMADTPDNNNGMAIRDPKSYATLAQAYNVEINGRKAVGKADDLTKNKNERVALVQQLLASGGDPTAYYYIPSLPRLYEHWNEARINVVIYDQAAVPAPVKAETKPSFSTTDVSTGNDPFNVNLRPYTTTYEDGAVLKGADVPQNFQNLLSNTLVAGNADLVDHPNRLEEVLVSAFLNSWQQNDGSFNQTDTAVGVNSPLYLYGGFGISNSDTKNSYSQWPNGYTTNTGDYLTATSHYSGDFYRGGKDLQLVCGGTVKGIPASALKADVSKVDLSKAGTYPVVYTYTNPNNAKDSASITVPVTVKDAAAPVFAFQGGSDVTLHVGESFDRTAYKVVGNWQIFNKSEGDYNQLVNYEGIAKNSKGEPDVTISGEVDTNMPGVYQVTYEATNLSGIKAKMVRKINVLPKSTRPDQSDWTVSVMKGVGYINYTPGYGINVWNAPAGTFTGQRLNHGTSWKIFQKAVNRQGKVYFNVGKNQWLDGAYVSFTPVSALQPLNGIVTINYVQGYGVNLWKAPSVTASYYDRKLPHGSKWRVMGQQDGFYNVGKNQWIQAKYAKIQIR